MAFTFVQNKYFIPMLMAQQSTPDDSSPEMAVRCGWGFVRYGTCRKHRSISLHYRRTSVTCETGIGIRMGVLRMRIVICRPAHKPSASTCGVFKIQLSLLQAVNINCREKFYFDPKFITCPNF